MGFDTFLSITVGGISIVVAAIGGYIATDHKTLRKVFIALGAVSFVLASWQTLRTSAAQGDMVALVTRVRDDEARLLEQTKTLHKTQLRLEEKEDQLGMMETGGDAYPSAQFQAHGSALERVVLMAISAFGRFGGASRPDSGLPEYPYFDLTIRNASSKYPLYAVRVSLEGWSKDEDGKVSSVVEEEQPLGELVPKSSQVVFGHIRRGLTFAYRMRVSARNGQFEITYEKKGVHDQTHFQVTNRSTQAVLESGLGGNTSNEE